MDLIMLRRDFREDIDDSLPLNAPVSPTAAHLGAGDVGWEALGPAIAFSFLATVVVSLRWYTRCKLVRCLGLDDYVILFSLALSWTMCGLVGTAVLEGIGSYNTSQRAVDTIMIAKLIVALNTVWTITINITKASILTQYLRIFSGRKTRTCCWLLLACLLPAAAWGIFGGVFLCSPTSKLWNPQLPGHCRNSQTYWASVAAVDIFLDILTLCLPIPSISSLHLPRKQKIATMLVFTLGFLVCAVSVVRLATVVGAAEAKDYVMSGIWSVIWSVVEANVGIVCASLLSLKVLVVKMFPGLMEETETPKHHMQIRKVSDLEQPVWSTEDSQAPTLAVKGAAALPPMLSRPEMAKKSEGGDKGLSWEEFMASDRGCP